MKGGKTHMKFTDRVGDKVQYSLIMSKVVTQVLIIKKEIQTLNFQHHGRHFFGLSDRMGEA